MLGFEIGGKFTLDKQDIFNNSYGDIIIDVCKAIIQGVPKKTLSCL